MPTTFLKNPVSVNVPSTAEGLNVSGIPAAATSGGGAQPANTLTVEGTAGQDTTGAAQTAGAGAHVSITAGRGGAAPGGSTNGAGGSVTINPGPPGTGIGTAAAYGNIVMATTGGRVGIGTTSPGYLLHLKPSGGVGLYLEGTATADVFASLGADPGNGPAFNCGYGGSSFGRGAGFFNVRPDAGATGINPALYFATNNTVRQVIDKGGNVGIGTNTPGSTLHVNGGVQVGVPTGGDMGAGSINVSGDIYRNGAPRQPHGIFARQDLLQKELEALMKRVSRLEAAPAKTTRTKTTTKKKKKKTSGKERR